MDSIGESAGTVEPVSDSGGSMVMAALRSEVALRVLLSPEPLFRLYRERWLGSKEGVIPELFTEAELAALQSEKVAEIVRARRSWSESLLSALPWAKAGVAPVAFEDFIAVLHAVRSHIHRVHLAKTNVSNPDEGQDASLPASRANYLAEDDLMVLVPGVGLANHAFRNSHKCNAVRTFDSTHMCFEIHAKRAVQVGVELRYDYSADAPSRHTSCLLRMDLSCTITQMMRF